jgi:hypothetical protein
MATSLRVGGVSLIEKGPEFGRWAPTRHHPSEVIRPLEKEHR